MNKKILKTGVAVCALIAMSMVVCLDNKQNVKGLDLQDLVSLSEADAECHPYSGFANGRCLTLSKICVFDTSATDCDPYKN